MRILWSTTVLGALALFACSDDSASLPPETPRAANEKYMPLPGAPLPPIAGITTEGERITNATFKGKTTLLNLWFVH